MQPLTEEEKLEAARIARIAKKAELIANEKKNSIGKKLVDPYGNMIGQSSDLKLEVRFISKAEREKIRKQEKEKKNKIQIENMKRKRDVKNISMEKDNINGNSELDEKLLEEIKAGYLGETKQDENKQKKKKLEAGRKRGDLKFQFGWDDSEDTAHNISLNPLYANKVTLQTKNNDLEYFEKRRARLLSKGNKNRTQGIFSSKGWREKTLIEMNPRDWRIFREDFEIHIIRNKSDPKQKNQHLLHKVSNPLRNWDELKTLVSRSLYIGVENLGHKRPTPIQMQCIPISIRDKRDVIGLAMTGSGKTLAFLVPLLNHVLDMKAKGKVSNLGENGPIGIILAPTRELANQIREELIRVTGATQEIFSRKRVKYGSERRSGSGSDSNVIKVNSALLVGGQDIHTQAMELRKGVEIVIATPGRLIDCLQSQFIVLSQCNFVVLDEADTMVDLGFDEQVEHILRKVRSSNIESNNIKDAEFNFYEKREGRSESSKDLFKSKERTTLMFSATMPPSVEKIAKEYMSNPVMVRIGDINTSKNQKIEQSIIFTSQGGKAKMLSRVLQKTQAPIMLFVNSRGEASSTARLVENLGYKVSELHAGKSQDGRESSLRNFRKGTTEVLVATDLAGRGIDVKGVKHVINYDMATNIERYTHRIGRTGRAGLSGLSTTFLTDSDEPVFEDLRDYLLSTNSEIPRELSSRLGDKDPGAAQVLY
eukprot:snap_masked-scaffold_4-processed-gene-11.49-mRNA-1 protein AED:0.06 eAED:0.08 QI:0/-1/0/1/-1/1/1/0/707